MQTHQIVRKNKNITKKTVGRGGTRGKTSGHGHKGQKQHGRHGIRPEMRDIIKKMPKLRGHGKNRARTVNANRKLAVVVNLSNLEEAFKDGEKVTVKSLLGLKLVKKSGGQNPKVKVLGNGDIKKKLNVIGCLVSDTAKAKIEKAGGTVK